MSIGTSARVWLRKACLVRYATYPHDLDVLASLAMWKAKVEAGHAAENGEPVEFPIIRKFNHVRILYYQANLPGEMAPGKVARECRSLIERRPLPERDRVIGLTSVVQARCRVEDGASSREIATTARDLLTVLTGSEHGDVRGGEISPGIGLWAQTDDTGWLVMLYVDEDGAECAADTLLVGSLWAHEVAAHKAERHFDQFRRLRRRLREQRESLHRSIDALAAVLDRHGDGGIRIDLEAALKQNAATNNARRVLNEMVGQALRMDTSLEAQRANLQTMRLLLGSGAGLEALEARRQRIGQMIAQVRADLDYTGPTLEAARDICALHQTTLLTEQNAIEKRENNMRETGNRRIALLGLWIGLMQVVSSIWLAYKDVPWLMPRLLGLTAVWAVIGVVGVAAWWFGPARDERLMKSQDPS